MPPSIFPLRILQSYMYTVSADLPDPDLLRVDTVVSAECSKTALETAADRIEFPISVMLVNFSNDDGCLDREILTKIIVNDLRSRSLIDDPDEGVGYLSEILTSSV